MSGRIPVLLDTDPGSDIDDALAIAYLLRQPRCELVGITTVTGEKPEQRAEIAAAICEDAGRTDVPIHVGAPGPILPGVGPGQPTVKQHESLPRKPSRSFERGTAVEFMRQTIRSRPGEVTLLAIGPLTNVALLFALDPQIPSLLREVVLMCGVFTGQSGWGGSPGGREWNAMVDPVATAIVFASRPPRFTSIGLDVTTRCILEAEDFRARTAGLAGMESVLAAADRWFHDLPRITFHDPLAAATLFEPELCGYAQGRVHVEPESRVFPGLTHFETASTEKPHRVATSVDSPRFFEHYFGVLRAAAAARPTT